MLKDLVWAQPPSKESNQETFDSAWQTGQAGASDPLRPWGGGGSKGGIKVLCKPRPFAPEGWSKSVCRWQAGLAV